MGLIFSEAGKAFKQALELRPEDFRKGVFLSDGKTFYTTDHRLTDVKTRLVWWISNGPSFFNFSDCGNDKDKNGDATFNLIERHFLWRYYKKWEERSKNQLVPQKKNSNREAAIKLAMALQPEEKSDE